MQISASPDTTCTCTSDIGLNEADQTDTFCAAIWAIVHLLVDVVKSVDAIQLGNTIQMGAMPRLLRSVQMLLRGSLAVARFPPATATSQLCCLRQLHCLRESAAAPCHAVACSRRSPIASARHSSPSVAHQHRIQRQQLPRRWHRLQSSASAAVGALVGDAAPSANTANKPRCSSSLPRCGLWLRQEEQRCRLATERTPCTTANTTSCSSTSRHTIARRLILLDAFAVLYRAHFSFGPTMRLVTSAGEDTSVLYGALTAPPPAAHDQS